MSLEHKQAIDLYPKLEPEPEPKPEPELELELENELDVTTSLDPDDDKSETEECVLGFACRYGFAHTVSFSVRACSVCILGFLS